MNSVVRGSLKWGQRAFTSVTDLGQSALVLYLGKEDKGKYDQTLKLKETFYKVIDYMEDSDVEMIPVMWSDESDMKLPEHIESLRVLLHLNWNEQLPMIFLYEPAAEWTAKFPHPLEDEPLIEEMSIYPRLIYFWA